MNPKNTICISFLLTGILLTQNNVICQDGYDHVEGNLIQFNDNGAWCWYQDERAVIDTAENRLITGSDASSEGTGGDERNGQVEGTIYELGSGTSQKSTFRTTGCDDHNVPGFIIRPDGRYLAMYADHYDYYNSRYRIFDGSEWSPEQQFDWMSIPGGTDYTIAYSNLYYLSEEDRMYNFARANHRSPNFIFSEDRGDTWSFGGQLSTNNTNSYNKGYYKYWSNGIDRIDFILTEEHPRDGLTSMYHGYIQSGKTFATDGTLVDANVFNATDLPTFEDFTLIFADNTIIDDNAMRKIWNADLMRYNNGVIAAILTCRINNARNGGDNSIDPDHALIYCRYENESWSYTYLSQAGKKLYGSEADYTGLGALHPNDPNILFISTHVDPRDDAELVNREIFKGVTDDNGATWNWTPVTWNSSRNNYRPVVPFWDETHTALLWMRGTYYAAQSFNMAIVGTIDNSLEKNDLMTYTDASAGNTTLADDSPFAPTGPDGNAGPADDEWHERTGFGNGGSVFTSSEVDGEDAPVLKTRIKASGDGAFDVWVNFWANPEDDWRIKAGFDQTDMQLFRHMACKQVGDGDHNTSMELSGSGNTYLYQAYLGRIDTEADSTFVVFVDDHTIQTGTSGSVTGNTVRTWYDGISYSKPLYVAINRHTLLVGNILGSTAAFDISANTGWNITGTETWLDISSASGDTNETIVLTAGENPEDSARMSVITVTADGIDSQEIFVYQVPASPVLSISPSELSIDAAENSRVSFDITSNTYWNITSSAHWLKAGIESGQNSKTVTLTASVNHTGSNRTGSVTVTAGSVTPQTITVTQGHTAVSVPGEPLAGQQEEAGYVFPNPVQDVLNIKLYGLPAEIRLYTLEGKKIMDLKAENTSLNINMTGINKGIYFLHIISQDKTTIEKIVRK